MKIMSYSYTVIVRFNEHLKPIQVEDARALLLVTYHDFYRPGIFKKTTLMFIFDTVIALNKVALSVGGLSLLISFVL